MGEFWHISNHKTERDVFYNVIDIYLFINITITQSMTYLIEVFTGKLDSPNIYTDWQITPHN